MGMDLFAVSLMGRGDVMEGLLTVVGMPSDPKPSITFSQDPEGDGEKVIITQTLRIMPATDEIGRRCRTLVDEDGNVLAIMVG